MTQMLLFDAPAGIADSTLLPAKDLPSIDVPQTPARTRTKKVREVSCDQGLNHMGDLARMVLLRYDLMAKRRAERAVCRAR